MPATGTATPATKLFKASWADYVQTENARLFPTYTATDSGAGVTSDSLQAWQSRRGEFGTFVRADVTGVAGLAGPSYAGQPGAALVAPSLVLTDDVLCSSQAAHRSHTRPQRCAVAGHGAGGSPAPHDCGSRLTT